MSALRRARAESWRATRRLPFAVWACALVALLNAGAWAIVTPPYQVPDEYKHVAYVDNITATGRPPTPKDLARGVPPDVDRGLTATWWRPLVFDVRMRPPWTAIDDARSQALLRQQASRAGGAEGANAYPPLYYYAAAAASEIDNGGTNLDRVMWMRFASVLFAGLAALFTALFVRELLPSRPWAWTSAGMVAAFQPMLGFMGGGVNNDSLLFACAAALVWLTSRALRRGLDARIAAAAGVALAAGVLTKSTMVALVPLATCGIGLAAWRRRSVDGRIPWRPLGLFAGLALLPVVAYALVQGLVWSRGYNPLGGNSLVPSAVSGGGGGGGGAPPHPWQLRELLSYTWQFYLPRLWFMNDQFGTNYPLWEVWFKGWIGRFGWQDTPFSNGVYRLALKIWIAVIALALVALWRYRDVLRRRWMEVVTYVVGTVGVLVVIHYVGYDYLITSGAGFEQARYLLVLLPIYAGFAALAAVGGGRRFGPMVAGALVVIAFGNSLAAMLLTAARYYG